MELVRYWKVFKKSQWLIALICVVGLIATYVFTIVQPPQYVSSSTLLLNPAVPSSLVPFIQTQVMTNLAESYDKIIHTRSFAESVQKELPSASIAEIFGSVSTRLVPNTLFFEMTVQSSGPDRSKQLLDAILKVFLSSNGQQAATGSGQDADAKEMRSVLQDEVKFFDDQIKSYQDRVTQLLTQPVTKERDDEILQTRAQIVTLHQTRAQTIVALGQLGNSDNAESSAIVIDQPLPGQKSSQYLARNLGLALIVTLLLGIGLAFLREYLDDTITTPEYMESELGMTPLAVIGLVGSQGIGPKVSRNLGRGRGGQKGDEARAQWAGRNLVALERAGSPDTESFRALRTNIQFSSVEHPIKTLVVTSAGPGEGKSFTASNLAVVMAQAGKRVILVDADLRRPSQHRIFGLVNSAGFTNMILNRGADVENAIQQVPGVENLSVVTSGPLPPNPSELLNTAQAMDVMASLSLRAEMVIYDSPPGGVATDATLIATRTDAVILVINAGTTRRDVMRRLTKSLQKVGVKEILPVLNRVRVNELKDYHYYYGYYGTPIEALAPSNHQSDNAEKNLGARSNGNHSTAVPVEKMSTSTGSES